MDATDRLPPLPAQLKINLDTGAVTHTAPGATERPQRERQGSLDQYAKDQAALARLAAATETVEENTP